MGRIGKYDHELKITSEGTATTHSFILMKDENGASMYRVENFVPQHQDPLIFGMNTWIGGHGQYDMVEPDMYFEGQGIDTTNDGRVILGPLINVVQEDTSPASDLDGNPVGFCWFPAVSKLLCWTATNIYHLDTQWDLSIITGGAAVTGVTDIKIFGTTAFAARGATTAYAYSTDGETWTIVTTLTDLYANGFLVAPNPDGTADILWKFKTPNEVSSNTSGTIAGAIEWTSPNYIGDTSSNITSIFLINDTLNVGKVNGLWYMDSSGGIHSLRPDLEQNRSTDNFKYITQWSAGVYFSEIDGMGEITSRDAYQQMGPLTKISNRTIGDIGRRGDVIGLAADKDWLYVAVDEGTNNYIYKGREVYKNGDLRWEWCPWVYLGTNACATLYTCQHTSSDRRLWFGYGNATAYVILSDNPTSDSLARFDNSGTSFIRMSYTYGTNPYWDKMWQSIVTETKGCSTTLKVTPKYRKNTDTDASALTTSAITTNGVVKTNLSAELTCNRMQFQLDLSNREPATTYTADTGTGTTTIVDSQLTSTTNDYYNGAYVFNTTRNLNGLISGYVGSSKTITCASIAAQASGDTYFIAFSASTPEVLSFQAKGIEKPETYKVHEAVYVIGDDPGESADTLRTLFRAGRTTTTLMRFADLRYGDTTGGTAGTDYTYVVMEPGYPQEVEITHKKDMHSELGIRVRLREVNFT